MKKVTILGVPYEVDFTTEKEDRCLVDKSGYCDYTNKKISIETQYDNVEVEDMDVVIRQTLRHEIIHGFLFESGLHSESWGTNEEIVDWIALQFPKMLEAFKEVGLFNDAENKLAEQQAVKSRMVAECDRRADRIKELEESCKELEAALEREKKISSGYATEIAKLNGKKRRGRPPKDAVHEAAVDILNTD